MTSTLSLKCMLGGLSSFQDNSSQLSQSFESYHKAEKQMTKEHRMSWLKRSAPESAMVLAGFLCSSVGVR